MNRSRLGKPSMLAALLLVGVVPATAHAEDPHGLAPGAARAAAKPYVTWGGAPADAATVSRDSPLTRAREMLISARFLDEAAAMGEKAAAELSARLTSLRAAAKPARERADSAAAEDRDLLGARADDLETDIIVTEAEVAFKRKAAAENRRVARELRLRAVKLVREVPADGDAVSSTCDPPFRYNADGRKLYRVECLK